MLTVFKYIFLLFFIECRRNKPIGVYIALAELVSLNILCLCTNLVQLGNAVALEILSGRITKKAKSISLMLPERLPGQISSAGRKKMQMP